MKYGYPLKFGPNLLTEVEFAVKNFDFIEFTLELDESSLNLLPSLSIEEIQKIKELTEDYFLISHFDWDINPSEHLKEIEQSIKILKEIGVQAITMHAYKNAETLEESVENAFNLITKINNFCKNENLKLRLENDAKGFFSKAENFKILVDKILDIGITIDVGHANRTSQTELDLFIKNFADRVEHFHLHKNIDQIDHLFFDNKEEFGLILSKMTAIGFNGTATLETHFILENGQKVYLNHREMLEKRRAEFLKQKKILAL